MRLLTRSDFDGLACAVLLKEMGLIDSYKFVHPKDIQDGAVEVTENDVLTNIPYVPGCGLWFDHHSSEKERLNLLKEYSYKGKSGKAPSCARVIYNYYGGAEKFSKYDETGLMEAVDRCDSGQLTKEEIENPTGWILLSFIMDPRTGLGRFRDYTISNYQLMEKMIEYCKTMTADEILEIPSVQERTKRYFEQEKEYEEMIRTNSRVEDNLLVIDLREVDPILSGNRFKEYVLYPGVNVSLRILWGFKKQNIVFTVGKSILDRSCETDVGKLMLKYGGGGHSAVGTCQVPIDMADLCLQEITQALCQNKAVV